MIFNIDDYKGKYAMHCKTREEAKDFCQYLHSIGRHWSSGSWYSEGTNYSAYGEDTAYAFNIGQYSPADYYYRNGYTILEWSDFMNGKFTKADLRTGDVAMQRDGTIQIVNCELGMFITNDWWNDMDSFNSDLTHNMEEEFDIIAVRRPIKKSDCTFKAFKYESGTLVYERKEVEEMTLAEVCKLLGKEIKIVK